MTHPFLHLLYRVSQIASTIGGLAAILFLGSRAALKYLPLAARPGKLNTVLMHLGLVLHDLAVL